ncbi:MAG: MraY family glycosyltransferase [Armatimonadota bacterium]
MNVALLSGIIAVVIASILTPIVRKFAISNNIIAKPGGRRIHAKPTALLGGIGMYLAFMIAVTFIIYIDPEIKFSRQVWGIYLGASIMALVGILDDKFELAGSIQALSIIIAACVLVLFDVRINYITNPFRGGSLFWLGYAAIPVTVIWVLMVTKAVDCMDGLDGLAAGICAIASFTLMLMAIKSGTAFVMPAIMGAALMGGAIGFLFFNYPPAKIFMGTIGSQFLGFTLAAISIMGAFKIATLLAVAVPILVLGVPLIDTSFVVLRRIANGKKIYEADRTHLHHRLLDRGLSHREVVWLVYLITIVFCGLGYLLFSYVE